MDLLKRLLLIVVVLFIGSAVIAGITDAFKKGGTVSESKKVTQAADKKEIRSIIQSFKDINQGMSADEAKKVLSKVGKVEEFDNIGSKDLGYIKDEISTKDGKEAIVVGLKDGKVCSKNYTADITDVDGKTDFAYVNYDIDGKFESGIWDRDDSKKNLAQNKSEDEVESMVVDLYN